MLIPDIIIKSSMKCDLHTQMFLGILCAWTTTNLSWSYDKCCATLWSLRIDVVQMVNGQLSFINEFVLTTSHPNVIRKQY